MMFDLDVLISRVDGGDLICEGVNEEIHYDVLGNRRPVAVCETCGVSTLEWIPDYIRRVEDAVPLLPTDAAYSIGRMPTAVSADVVVRIPARDVVVTRSDGYLARAIATAGLMSRRR